MIETRGAQRADPASRPGQMSRILVVEDSRDIADGIALNLTLEGHEVQIARDGERGLAACRTWDPELVVLDLLLPVLDGYAVLQALRTEGREVPVLILSALVRESLAQVGDVPVEGSRLHARRVAPDVPQQVVASQDGVRAERECDEQVERLAAQRDLRVTKRHASCARGDE